MTINTFKTILSVMLATLIVCIAMPVQAKVSVEEAERLKNELTPTGAERAGNKEGTIPPWTGGLSKIPENVSFDPASREFRPDPFAEDKILFTITAENVDKYKDKLCQGLLWLFKRYPDTWKMNIYPTRRSAAFSEEIYQGTYENALTAEVVDRDGSMANFYKGFVFPIPQNGAEAVLNHINRPRGVANMTLYHAGGVVNRDGSFASNTLVRQRDIYMVEVLPKEEFNPKDYIIRSISDFQSAGRKGEVYLTMFRANFTDDDNGSWSYLPGTRRVRRNPNSFYDGVDSINGNMRTSDDSWMYSGKIDRYNWKLNGKKEMFVPYNNYQFDLVRNMESVLTPKHINPQYMRWELHRTWEVVGTLREGSRHIYAKRIFYIDEDSWRILLKDQYDKRGNFWRFGLEATKQFYDIPAYLGTNCPSWDNQQEAYVSGFIAEPAIFEEVPLYYYTPQHLRKIGKR